MRAIGTELGLPDEIVWRQPFPGPGLGIRIIGEITKERLDLLREADAIAREELSKAGLDRDIWQCPISTRITNECRQINRVVLDCTSKPPATIEWE